VMHGRHHAALGAENRGVLGLGLVRLGVHSIDLLSGLLSLATEGLYHAARPRASAPFADLPCALCMALSLWAWAWQPNRHQQVKYTTGWLAEQVQRLQI
jgi:hypothetical protein